MKEITVGTGRRLREGTDVAVLSLGPIGNNVTRAIKSLEEEGSTLSVAHYDMRFAKPLDSTLLEEVAARFDRIITIEDGCIAGGFGSAVAEWLSDHGKQATLRRLGLPDQFVEHGTVGELQHLVGIDAESIKKTILSL
jgi:1-deoxy-D-xylulose-5-phosphate synthase